MGFRVKKRVILRWKQFVFVFMILLPCYCIGYFFSLPFVFLIISDINSFKLTESYIFELFTKRTVSLTQVLDQTLAEYYITINKK